MEKVKKRKITKVEVRSFGKKTDFIFNVLIGLLAVSCIFPFLFVIGVSMTSEAALSLHGYRLFPKEISWEGYKFLFEFRGPILQSLLVTVSVTILGTLMNTTFTSAYAYAISRKDFKYRNFFTKFALITMLFSAGMIPNYLVVTKVLNVGNTIWALILPMALSPFNIMLMRTFFRKTISDSIIESSRIDGAGEFRIFAQIVIPLAVPGIATISLFAALGFWNDWFNALLYINNNALYPLQYLLMQIQSNLDYIAKNVGNVGISSGMSIPRESARMAMVVISTLPIALTYPFFQKHFVSGLTIGGVKG